MSEHHINICFERIIPPQYESIAFQKAQEENPANILEPRSPFEAAVLRTKLWKPGRTLRVKFLDGVREVQEKVDTMPNSGLSTRISRLISVTIRMQRYGFPSSMKDPGQRSGLMHWSKSIFRKMHPQ